MTAREQQDHDDRHTAALAAIRGGHTTRRVRLAVARRASLALDTFDDQIDPAERAEETT